MKTIADLIEALKTLPQDAKVTGEISYIFLWESLPELKRDVCYEQKLTIQLEGYLPLEKPLFREWIFPHNFTL